MFISKTVTVVEKTATAPDLELINALTKKPLKEDEVYTFSVRLCDDQPDRDMERFSIGALQELAKLFVGRPGIFDHAWTAHGQTARLYAASVEKVGAATCLIGKAYVLKTDENEPIIAAIDGGILKEVSIACSMKKATCTICGKPYGSCDHRRGSTYDGEICYAELSEAVDAYEFSFVAVPAQPAAGVVKGKVGDGSLPRSAPLTGRTEASASTDNKMGACTGASGMPRATGAKTMSVEEAERAKARLRLEKLRYGGT